MKKPYNLMDLVGSKHGRWTVLSKAPSKKEMTMWLCACECGNQSNVSSKNLRKGNSKSCGCLRSEVLATHGATKNYTSTLTYERWKTMRSRCRPNGKASQYYFDKGIKVCKRWGSFSNFLEDMGECPDKMTLERINNLKGYEPTNCKWATMKEQSRNKINTHKITFNGITKTIGDWAIETGKANATILSRLRAGMSAEEALTLRRVKYKNKGQKCNQKQT